MGNTNNSASTVSSDNMEQIPLEDTLKYMEDGDVIRDSRYKSCLGNPGSFYDGVTASPDNGEASKAFYEVPDSICAAKLERREFKKLTVSWIRN